jgi:hypothetical protein
MALPGVLRMNDALAASEERTSVRLTGHDRLPARPEHESRGYLLSSLGWQTAGKKSLQV